MDKKTLEFKETISELTKLNKLSEADKEKVEFIIEEKQKKSVVNCLSVLKR